jgi:hypothetical protein
MIKFMSLQLVAPFSQQFLAFVEFLRSFLRHDISNLFPSIRKPASEIMVERRWRWKGYEFGEIEDE